MVKGKTSKNKEPPRPLSDLSWLELQILYLLDQKPTYQRVIVDRIKELYTKGKKFSESTLYLTLSKLRDRGLLNRVSVPDSGKGFKIFLQTSPEGKKELKNAIHWSLLVLFNRIAEKVLSDFQKTCQALMKCQQDTSILYIAPTTISLPRIMQTCENCSKWNRENPRQIFLTSPIENTTIEEIEKYEILLPKEKNPAKIPLENDSVDRILSLFTLNLFPPENLSTFLKETHRVLKKKGQIGFITLQKVDSYIIEGIHEITGQSGIIPLLSPKQEMLIQNYFTTEQIKALITPWYPESKATTLKEFQYVVAKKIK